MDDENGGGFKDRVDKVFGSITSSITSSSLWSVTDGKVERREWKRSSTTRNDDEIPVSSSYFPCLNQDADADFDIRSSIGLDSTLDHEEEEDAYDKMAQGKENDADDCLFMKDVTCYGPYLNSHNVVKNHPFSSQHNASPITRLSEDEEEDDDDEPMLNAQQPCLTVRPPNDGICRTKSILKRKNDHVSRPAKRVRFDPTCKNQDDELTNVVRLPRVSNNGSRVPDYILNPSKYTRYNLDDISYHAYEGPKSGASLEPKSSFGELPRSLVFIPRKKKADNSEGQQVKQSSTQAASSIAVAAQNDEASEIQGDDVCTKASKFQKPDRRYRSKMEEDDNVC